jgi:hypothetical protein
MVRHVEVVDEIVVLVSGVEVVAISMDIGPFS